MKRYSRVYKVEENRFRYNYTDALLELVYKNENGKDEMLDAIGLSNDNWNYDKVSYLMIYNNDVETELAFMLANELDNMEVADSE